MSTIANESLLESIYDEVWVEYAKANDLTFDQLDAIDQGSELGYLPLHIPPKLHHKCSLIVFHLLELT